MRRLALAAALIACATCAGYAAATTGDLAAARSQAEQSRRRSAMLEQAAAKATGEAARARAEAAALAGRIEAAEADITAAEARIRLIEELRRAQRARLAEQQGPLVRLTAALQTMARRPAALSMVRPGSLDEVVRVRALLASTLPEIRRRTAGVRAELARGDRLRVEAGEAVEALRTSRGALRERRIALARFERSQRARSETLMESALTESDRALAFGEEARTLAQLAGTRAFQQRLERSLSELPGPILRPVNPPPAGSGGGTYRLPAQGRLLTGFGEISDAGVHARGLVFETRAGTEVTAPASGRIAWAGRFRGYGEVVIIDHGQGWMSTLTDLSARSVAAGQRVTRGTPLGTAGQRLGVELRRNGRPFPITLMMAG
jgi:septal ring factor EnvC (AmiA/AmiB activator)